jgi:hypothetical protein
MTAQVFDSLLQMDATGALDEDDVTGPEILYEPLTRSIGVAKKDGGHSAGACGGGQVLRIALHCDHEI